MTHLPAYRALTFALFLAFYTVTNAAYAEQQFLDVVDVKAALSQDGSFNFDVTVSSPYDNPARYANAC